MQSRARGAVEAVAIKNLKELLRKRGITAESLFTKYDLDGNGSIDSNEFRSALQSITGQQAPDSILSAIFSAVDANADGNLDLEEILVLSMEVRQRLFQRVHQLRLEITRMDSITGFIMLKKPR